MVQPFKPSKTRATKPVTLELEGEKAASARGGVKLVALVRLSMLAGPANWKSGNFAGRIGCQ